MMNANADRVLAEHMNILEVACMTALDDDSCRDRVESALEHLKRLIRARQSRIELGAHQGRS